MFEERIADLDKPIDYPTTGCVYSSICIFLPYFAADQFHYRELCPLDYHPKFISQPSMLRLGLDY